MNRADVTRDELEAIVAEYRHVRAEHAHARAGGRVRRHLERRLARIDDRFEHLLSGAAADSELRRAWLEHLRSGAPAPAEPSAQTLPLVFRGRSGAGSLLEVRERPDGDYDVLVDGAAVERVEAADDFAQTGPGVGFHVGGVVFDETVDASPEALAALALFVSEPGREPPFEHARELIADGLVDRDFGVTARGRRALRLEGRGLGGEAQLALQVSAGGGVGEQPRRYLERKLRHAVRLSPLPVIGARAVLTEAGNPSLERRASAKATLELSGRHVHAHAAAGSLTEAIDLLAERLSRLLRGLEERREANRRRTGVGSPGEWRHGAVRAPRPGWFPRPAEERGLVPRRTYTPQAMSPEEAAWELRRLGHDFYLFTSAPAGGEAVVYRRADGAPGLKQVDPSAGASGGPFPVDPDPAPVLLVDEALRRLEAGGEPFVFFVDADTRRGRVVYRRRDGHYGLVEPELP